MSGKVKYPYAVLSLMLLLVASFSILSLAASFNGQTAYHGRVYASNGVPIANAVVVAGGVEGYGYAISGVDGDYEIDEGLKTGTYNVRVSAFGYIDSDISGVSIAAGSPTTLDFFLNLSGGISGVVHSSEGTPLQGMTLIAFSEDEEYFSYATTNVDGTYLMATNLETGTYNVTVFFPEGYVSNKTSGIVVTRGIETKNVEITLFPSGIIAGRVEGLNEVPVANATVIATCADTPEYIGIATTDENGDYTIDSGLGTGTYTVIVSKGAAYGFYGGLIPAEVIVVAGETTSNIDITIATSPLPTGSISGKVTDTEDRPIEGATVSASGTDFGSATTDENGNYKIYDLPAGTYTVSASANGFQTQDRTAIEVVAYQDTPNINFQLDPVPPEQSGTLRGTITGEMNPIPEFHTWVAPLLLLGTATAIALLKVSKHKKARRLM